MDYSSLITNNTFPKLECDSCKNYLSYFPIFISEEKKNICGRCSDAFQKNYARNEVYEALAQLIKFPCRYKDEGCPENPIPKETADHEKICDFRVVKCPVKDCIWVGARPTILLHSQGKHSDLILKNGEFQLDMNQSHQRENLLEHDSALFIVKQKFDSINKLMEISICNLEHEVNVKDVPCEISFKTTNRGLTVQYCIKAFNEDNVIEVILDSLKDRNNLSSLVTGKIHLESDNNDNTTPVEEKVDRELLSQLKCFKCKEYCLPPINFQESSNAIHCSTCIVMPVDQSNDKSGTFGSSSGGSNTSQFGKVRVMPANQSDGKSATCGSLNGGSNTAQFGQLFYLSKPNQQFTFSAPPTNPLKISNEIRNIFDNIANLQNYPCKYEKNGCTFVAKPPQMTTHLRHCPYGTYKCPLAPYIDCGWNGIGRDMKTHIINSHDTIILNSSIVSEKIPSFGSNPANTFSKYYIIRFVNHLFLLNFVEIGQCYQWHMQMIGPFEQGYMFELEIIDRNKMGRTLVSKHPCITLKKTNERFVSSGCYFYKDQVKSLLSDEMITFKVHIFK